MKHNRELTFAEKKVNFINLNRMGLGLSQLLDKKLIKFLPILVQKKATKDTIEQITNIVTFLQKEAFEVGKKSASSEMKLKTLKTNSKIINIMKSNNRKIITKIINDIKNKLTSKGFSEEGLVSQFLNGLKTLFIHGAINMGRDVVFEQNPEMVYAFQYSAILDSATTELCSSLDGLTIKPNDPRRQKYNPPNHWNCRSIWVEILVDEEHPPELEIKIPEGDKIMKKYKDNALDVGIEKMISKVIESGKRQEDNPPEFNKELYETSVVQILDKKTGIVDYYIIPKGELEFYKKEIDGKIAGENVDGKIYHITAFNPKNGFDKFIKNQDFIYKGIIDKNIIPKKEKDNQQIEDLTKKVIEEEIKEETLKKKLKIKKDLGEIGDYLKLDKSEAGTTSGGVRVIETDKGIMVYKKVTKDTFLGSNTANNIFKKEGFNVLDIYRDENEEGYLTPLIKGTKNLYDFKDSATKTQLINFEKERRKMFIIDVLTGQEDRHDYGFLFKNGKMIVFDNDEAFKNSTASRLDLKKVIETNLMQLEGQIDIPLKDYNKVIEELTKEVEKFDVEKLTKEVFNNLKSSKYDPLVNIKTEEDAMFYYQNIKKEFIDILKSYK